MIERFSTFLNEAEIEKNFSVGDEVGIKSPFDIRGRNASMGGQMYSIHKHDGASQVTSMVQATKFKILSIKRGIFELQADPGYLKIVQKLMKENELPWRWAMPIWEHPFFVSAKSVVKYVDGASTDKIDKLKDLLETHNIQLEMSGKEGTQVFSMKGCYTVSVDNESVWECPFKFVNKKSADEFEKKLNAFIQENSLKNFYGELLTVKVQFSYNTNIVENVTFAKLNEFFIREFDKSIDDLLHDARGEFLAKELGV